MSPRELAAWAFLSSREDIAETRNDINATALGSRGKADAIKDQIKKLDEQL